MTTLSIGQEGFRWFIGTIEDIDDPLKLGRVKVRVMNEHDDDIEPDQMPWAQVMVPVTSASLNGIGISPTGIDKGTYVFGFFIDGNEKQFPMVVGSYHIIPGMDDNKHAVNGLAREKNIINKTTVSDEPTSPYAAKYPNNKVLYTKSGHAIEIDDTQGSERIHVYHKSGSYVEINNEGRIVLKAMDNSQEYVLKDKILYVKGDLKVSIDGDVTATVKGKADITTSKDTNVTSSANVNIKGKKINLN